CRRPFDAAFQPPELTTDDAAHPGVELVEHVLRSAVAGVAATVGDRTHGDRRVADPDRHARTLDATDPTLRQHERERAWSAGCHDVGAVHVGPWGLAPPRVPLWLDV